MHSHRIRHIIAIMQIGIFDSGIGGEAVAERLREYLPSATIFTTNDSGNLPYGDKSLEEIRRLTDSAIQPLIGSDVIVIACNSATAAAIEFLRDKYPEQIFIGLEPMIKPAASISETRVIGVCATPATLSSDRYNRLIEKYADGVIVVEPDCSSWAAMIENNQVNDDEIKATIRSMVLQRVDVIVLGCTHYHWIKESIEKHAGADASVLEPSKAISQRIKHLLSNQPQSSQPTDRYDSAYVPKTDAS